MNPYLNFNGNCREALSNYQQVLGAKLLFQHTWAESPMADQMPEGQGCSNSLMHDMTSNFLETHVNQREYLEGMLYFKKRFDLEGAVVEDISPKHLKSAQNRLAKLTGTEVS